MTQPVRLKRVKGVTTISPNGLPIAYVGRGSTWENPFRVEKMSFDGKYAVKVYPDSYLTAILTHTCKAVYDTKEEAKAAAFKCYEIMKFPYKHEEHGNNLKYFFLSQANYEEIRRFLQGKNLSCWCEPDDPTCHAAMLLHIANSDFILPPITPQKKI